MFFSVLQQTRQNLIQLSKPKLLNILDYDSVGILDVQATFNYVGANKNFYLPYSKVLHGFFKLLGILLHEVHHNVTTPITKIERKAITTAMR